MTNVLPFPGTSGSALSLQPPRRRELTPADYQQIVDNLAVMRSYLVTLQNELAKERQQLSLLSGETKDDPQDMFDAMQVLNAGLADWRSQLPLKKTSPAITSEKTDILGV